MKTLRPADFSGGRFHGLQLSRMPLGGVNLFRADFTAADLSWADLKGADLLRANLAGADLMEVDLAGADLSWADLAGVNLAEGNLRGVRLLGANLAGVCLEGANLRSAMLMQAQGVEIEPLLLAHLDRHTSLADSIANDPRVREHIAVCESIDESYLREPESNDPDITIVRQRLRPDR